MKYLYPLSLLLLILTSCGKDEKKVIDREKTDWAFYKLNGDVETLSEKSFETTDGITKGKVKHEIMSEHNRDLEFNESGLLITEKTFSSTGAPFEDIRYKGKDIKLSHTQYSEGKRSIKTDYVWDKKGKNNLTIIRRNPDNSPYDRIVMKYKNDKITERITYNNQDNPSNRITYSYNTKGNLVEENHFESADVLQYKTIYKYNEKNQRISETHYNKEGKVDYQLTYTFSGDNIASVETTDANGVVTYVKKNGYDSKGNMVTEYSFDTFDKVHMRDEYTYDANGNRTEWDAYKNEETVSKAVYKYDKYGNLTQTLVTDAEGNVLESKTYRYEYDKKGNWIRKLYLTSNQPLIITERKITYFK